MLVLTRNPQQSIIINNDIEVVVLEIRGNQVRIGIEAPTEVSVHRSEIYDRIQKEKLLEADKVTREEESR